MDQSKTNQRSGTLVGFTAIIMWGFLALFSKMAGEVPPLQLIAMSFLIGGLLGVASWPFRPKAMSVLTSQNWRVWTLNVGALFGCHFLYFLAVRNAPVGMVLGAASYIAPLHSTVILITAGFAVFHWSIAIGCLLITVGAAIATKDMFFKKPI